MEHARENTRTWAAQCCSGELLPEFGNEFVDRVRELLVHFLRRDIRSGVFTEEFLRNEACWASIDFEFEDGQLGAIINAGFSDALFMDLLMNRRGTNKAAADRAAEDQAAEARAASRAAAALDMVNCGEFPVVVTFFPAERGGSLRVLLYSLANAAEDWLAIIDEAVGQ